ncbi:MAG: hypothetical protein ACOX2K_00500 [Bacillota bacterium]
MEFEFNGVALVPLIIGLVEVAKRVGLSTKLSPLLSLLLGLGAGFLLYGSNLSQAIITGAMIGLSASGLYSGAKAVVGK